MKRKTKKNLMALFLVLAMFGSSFAFIFMNTFPEEQKEEQKLSFINEGRLDDSTEENFIGNGFTILRFYYEEGCCSDIVSFVDNIPDSQRFSYNGQNQIIIEKITENTENPYIVAESFYEKEITNITESSDIKEVLCGVLIAPPEECGASSINWTD